MIQSTQCLGCVVPLATNRQRWMGIKESLVATVVGLFLKQYEIPDCVIMILCQFFLWSFFRLFFWSICRKRIQSAFSVLQPSAYERVMQSVYTIKSTHNQFQHYKKNINVALFFCQVYIPIEVNFIGKSFTVIMLYTITTSVTIIALALRFCQIHKI